MGQPGYSPDAAARGRRYQMRRLGLGLASDGVEWAVTAVFFLLAARVEDWGQVAGGPFWQGVLFFAALATLRGLAALPLDFRAGFRLPHSAGLSNQTLGGWWSDRGKGWALQLVIGGGASGGFLALTLWRPEGWWWAAGLLAAGLGLVLALLGPIVLAPIFFKFKPLADETLRARLEGLIERTGARVRGGVWEMDMSRRTKGANAALVGWGPSRRVVLADNLVNEYSADETEAVLAHELAHHAGRHIPQLMAGRAVFLLAGLYVFEAALGAPGLWAWAGGAPEAGGPALIAALWAFLTLWGAALAPFGLAYARRLERQCDAFALRHASAPAGLAAALAKLGEMNLADPDPPGWVTFFFHSHPPLKERIARAAASAESAGAAASGSEAERGKGAGPRAGSGRATRRRC